MIFKSKRCLFPIECGMLFDGHDIRTRITFCYLAKDVENVIHKHTQFSSLCYVCHTNTLAE